MSHDLPTLARALVGFRWAMLSPAESQHSPRAGSNIQQDSHLLTFHLHVISFRRSLRPACLSLINARFITFESKIPAHPTVVPTARGKAWYLPMVTDRAPASIRLCTACVPVEDDFQSETNKGVTRPDLDS